MIFGLFIMLCGCTSKPDDKLIMQQIEENLREEWLLTRFYLADFEKVNGISESDISYTAEVRFILKDGDDLVIKIPFHRRYNFVKTDNGWMYSGKREDLPE